MSKWLALAAAVCFAGAARADTSSAHNAPPQQKSLIKVLVVMVLGYEDPPSPVRVVAEKPASSLGKSVTDFAPVQNDGSKKRPEFRP